MYSKTALILKSSLLIISLLALAACTQSQDSQDEQISETNQQTEDPTADETDAALTPEEVLAQMDAAEGIGEEQGPVTVEIISPEEETFQQSQARQWRATIDGLQQNSRCSCDWKFYLNQYAEEELYEQMPDNRCTSTEQTGQKICGFTSTLIENRGDLRVTVDVEVTNFKSEVLQTASAEKEYRVL